jgi:phosphonate transport system ATP-binding protein
MSKIYDLHNVKRQYGSFPALSDLDIQIETGERVALVGPSGAGKSTLIRLLNGSLLPTGGQLYILGEDVATLNSKALRQLQKGIGTVYQQFHLVDTLRVVHNVNAGHLGDWPLHKALFSLLWPQDVPAAINALNQVGIPEKLYQTTGTLSGGQQQRVAIARLLVQNPQVILADEPIASLDPERGREILELLTQISKVKNSTIITSLHAIELALLYFERIIGLRDGRIMFDLPAGEVSETLIQRLYRIPE